MNPSAAALVVPIPNIATMDDYLRFFVYQTNEIQKLKELIKIEEAKLEPELVKRVEDHLLRCTKNKCLFHIPDADKRMYGECLGIRLEVKTRPEYLNKVKYFEVCKNAANEALRAITPFIIPGSQIDLNNIADKAAAIVQDKRPKVDVPARVVLVKASAKQPAAKRAKHEVEDE